MKSVIFYSISIVLCFLHAEAQSEDSTKYVPLENCLQSSSVQFSARSLGGHSGFCIEATLKNTGNESLNVMIEPGRRLVADSSMYQDIFIVKKQLLSLLPGEKKKISVYGFCCESSDRGPQKDLKYSVGYMAPPAWVNLAEYIDTNDFPVSAVQSAVWVVSNNHDIAGVDCGDSKKTYALRKTLCDLTGKEMPWATLKYKEDSTVVFTGTVNRIRGDIQYYVRYNTSITIYLTDAYGRIVKTLMDPTIQGIGRQTYYLDLDVSSYPAGDYEVRVYEDESILLERKKFTI